MPIPKKKERKIEKKKEEKQMIGCQWKGASGKKGVKEFVNKKICDEAFVSINVSIVRNCYVKYAWWRY